MLNSVQFKDMWFARLHVAIMITLTLSTLLICKFHNPMWLIVSVVIFKLIERFGLYLGLHMWASHNIINPTGVHKILICISMLMSNIGRASFFAKYHTIHHQHVDTEKDPHSPKYMNKWYLIFGLYPLTMHEYDQYSKDSTSLLPDDKLLAFVDRYYYRILFGMFTLGLICSVQYTFYFLMLPMLMCNVNNNIFFVYYLHRGGKARNHKWINYWIFDKGGEHRTHHMVGKYIEHNL